MTALDPKSTSPDMPGFPRSAKFRRLFAAFGSPQRRQFWQATGIDISKQAVNEEMLEAFKARLADYRERLAKSRNDVQREPAGTLPDSACAACGRTADDEIYVAVPKCGRFCAECIKELIRDMDSIA